MKTILLSLVLLLLESGPARAVDPLVYDQQSSTNNSGDNRVGAIAISAHQPIGQSFVPAFSNIDFIRFRFSADGIPTHLLPSGTVSVNLWSGGISNGVLLAVTAPVFISLTFPTVFYTNFFFDAPVALTPGATYYLQPLVQSETGNLNIGFFSILTLTGHYANGMAFINGIAQPDDDLWFREGIVAVPEPASGWLLFLAAAFGFCLRLGKRSFPRPTP